VIDQKVSSVHVAFCSAAWADRPSGATLYYTFFDMFMQVAAGNLFYNNNNDTL